MNVNAIVNNVRTVIGKNSPVILTVVGVTGTVATAYLAAIAGYKAGRWIEFEQTRLDSIVDESTQMGHVTHQMTLKEKVNDTWPLFVPAAATAALTITAVIFSHRISTRRAAAMAAAYELSSKAYAEYKEKVREQHGEKKEQAVRDAIAQDRVDRASKEVVIVSGEVLMMDAWSGRTFMGTIENVKAAKNEINQRILGWTGGYQSVGDFYDLIGLPQSSISEELGFTMTNLLDLEFSGTITEDNRPCISFEFSRAPVANYWKQG